MARQEKQQIAWNTGPVLARYRIWVADGMGGLEASKAVLVEVQGRGLGVTESRTESRTESPRTESPRTGRPKKWSSEAERLRAYRERQESKLASQS